MRLQTWYAGVNLIYGCPLFFIFLFSYFQDETFNLLAKMGMPRLQTKVKLVSSDPTYSKIVQRYRKLVSVHHADKGGDKDKIQEINEAYAALNRP